MEDDVPDLPPYPRPPKLSRFFNKAAQRPRHRSQFMGEGNGTLTPELPFFPWSQFVPPPARPASSRFVNPPKPGSGNLRTHWPGKPRSPTTPKK